MSIDELVLLQEQEPNTHFFLFPFTHLVYLYQWGYANYDSIGMVQKRDRIGERYDRKMEKAKTKKEKRKLQSKKIRKQDKWDSKIKEGNLRMRWGEKLAVFDSSKYLQTKENFKNYLFSIGHFDAEVETRYFKTEEKKTSIKLKVIEGPQYMMDSMIYDIQNEKISEIFNRYPKQRLLDGEPYSQDLITRERDRVYELLSNNGYYDFKRQYVIFEVDSASLDDQRLIVKEIIANPIDKEHKQYQIDSVIFTANPNESYVRRREPSRHNNITFNLTNNVFYPRVVDWRIFTYPDSLYNKQLVQETQKQLGYLDMFKFVNINHDTTGGRFVTNIFTSPLSKYQTSFEGGLSILESQAQGLPGPFINFNAKNRNTFKGLEILQLDGSASIQGINGVSKETSNSRKYSRLQYGATLSITFPQFVFPIKNAYKKQIGAYNPKTKAAIGVNFEYRFGEYERTTFNSSWTYTWQISDNLRFNFKPYEVAYIRSINSDAFKAELDTLEANGNISYVSAFKSSFVSNSAMSMDYNSGGYGLGNVNAKFLHMEIEYGGLLQPILGDTPFRKDLTYYKYLKGGIDFRQSVRLDRKTSFVYRTNIGVAYVFGSSRSLPYEKYYFAGGSNSIRAWQPRRLGPGAYGEYIVRENGDKEVNYDREQPGDIIVELSAEIRRDFFAIFDYALFVDAGNVWLWRSKTIDNNLDPQGDRGKFNLDNFASEVAVGAGAGLRIDMSFLVMRIDAAYKFIDPAVPLNQRYVLDELKPRNLWPRINWNFGIGYPF